MNWKLKAHVLATLSRTPGGKSVYNLLQRTLRTNELNIDEYLGRALEVVDLAHEAGFKADGGVWFEIGTGWWPVLPILLYLNGAARVISFDINPWLSARRARDTFLAIGTKLDVVGARLGLSIETLSKRYEAARPYCNDLGSLLSACRTVYRCPADARTTELADGSVDVVCSSNVLEHVPAEVLQSIHQESFRILRLNGFVVHRFNPADHFSFSDRSITSINFLRFDSKRWYWYGGSGLAFHNRLRCAQHRELLRQSGFSIRIDRTRTDQRGLQALRDRILRVHPDFLQFTPEELAAEYMWLVGEKVGC